MVVNNKPLILLMLSFVLTFAVNSITGAVGLYYTKYFLKRPDLFTVMALLAFLPIVIIMPFILGVIRKYGKKRVLLFSLFGGTIVSVIKFLLPANPILFVIVNMVGALFLAPLGIVLWAFVPETIEYGEWKTGVRTEGFINAIVGFAFKFGMAAGGIIPGFVLSITGYVPNVDQTTLSLWGIRALVGLIPAILLLISFIVYKNYELVEERYEEIVEELNKRKEIAEN